MISSGYRSDTHNIVYRGEDGKRVVCSSLEEAEALEKKGGYAYLEIKPELQKIIHKPNIFKDVPKPREPSVIAALLAFSTGDASPEILAVLLRNLDVLSDYTEPFDEITGRRLSPYVKKLSAIKASLNQKQERVLVDNWEAHSLRLPCNHLVHVSNLQVGMRVDCYQCPRTYAWREIEPLVLAFTKANPDLGSTQSSQKSRFDIFRALSRRQ